eukprot:TRINITY_DN13849_c0_g1_i2.p1 TRINITY_DN13849_c0_g1~~TRINITY_DN13849_c0_g1_i2.p1  ORF type:complete len:548 (-),score=94.74 TRINITY_DN13849_c0_g1_i2:371-2014(-)
MEDSMGGFSRNEEHHHNSNKKASDINAAGQRRRQLASIIGKERREAFVRAKRFRTATISEGLVNGESMDIVDIDTEIGEHDVLEEKTRRAVEKLRLALSPKKGARKLLSLRNLRKLLSCNARPPIDVAVKAGVVPLLVQCLALGSSEEQLLESAWCLTNIASGDPEQTMAIAPAIPLLIAHISDTRISTAIAEQCVWAMGNCAGDSSSLRDSLLHQGALLPMYHLMGARQMSLAKTSCWAMSNLIKGPNPTAAIDLMKLNSTSNMLINYIATGDEELATEAAWVLVYLTSMSENNSDLLVKSGLFPPLVTRLATSQSVILLPPILRTIGNILAGDTQNAKTDNLLAAGGFVGTVSQCLGSEHRSLQKEAAWVVSNISAGTVFHKQAVFTGGALPALLHLLATAAFDVRKEAAYAIGNMCVGPGGNSEPILEHLTVLLERGCLPGFITLVRSPDLEAARLGLQFLDLVMQWLTDGQGPKLVEKEDGIDAIESLQNHDNDDLREYATSLMDKYFGDDYGLEEEYAPGIMEVVMDDQGEEYPPWRERSQP